MTEYWNIEDQKKIIDMFTYHPPKGNQAERYVTLRNKMREVAEAIIVNCPPSRERSVALTTLQEASMWANASIAINESNNLGEK